MKDRKSSEFFFHAKDSVPVSVMRKKQEKRRRRRIREWGGMGSAGRGEKNEEKKGEGERETGRNTPMLEKSTVY